MLIDLRTYTLHPGKTEEYLKVYDQQAKNLQLEHLGNLVGFFTSESGQLNEVIHIWAYRDYQDRAERRRRLWADPNFLDAAQNLYPLIQRQENRLMTPAPFSPLR